MSTPARIPLADIPVGEGRTIVVDDEPVAVFRGRDGAVRALTARCPHLGGPLADGLTDDRVVVCPLHGRAFDLHSGAEVGGDLVAAPWDATVTGGEACITRRTAPAARLT